MKKFMILFIIIGLVFMGITCDFPWDEDDDDDQSQLLALLAIANSSSNFFYNAAKEIAPTFTAASRQARGTWESGNVNYELYSILRDYVSGTSGVGLENIYKVLYQAGEFYTSAESVAVDITEQTIASPFDLGNSVAYDKAYNDTDDNHGYAIKDDGTTKYGLLTWQNTYAVGNQWGFSPGEEYGVLQGSYNE